MTWLCPNCKQQNADLNSHCQYCVFPRSLGYDADDIQVDGDHYKDMGVQPWAVMQAVLTREEFIGYLKGAIIKYGMRQGKKDLSPKDAEKCKHYIQKLKEVTNGVY
jgi:predicted nucleotidyltransferase